MKISIIGSGAMGCRFGVAFADAGVDVYLYDVWQQHVDNINSNGLVIEDGYGGNKCRMMKAVTDINELPVSDAIMIFTKSMYTRDAVKNALPIIGDKTVMVTLQNGLGNIEAIRDITQNSPIIAGVTNYASDLLEPGRVELKGSGMTKMMALDDRAKPMAEKLCALLISAGHIANLSEDVLVDIWEKVAFNAALNSTTAITGLPVGAMGSVLKVKQLLFEIASEIVAVANAENVKAKEAHVHEIIESVFDPQMSGDHKTSMLQDRLLKRKTEIESICGVAITIGQKHGIQTPKLECVYALVRAIEDNYGKICL